MKTNNASHPIELRAWAVSRLHRLDQTADSDPDYHRRANALIELERKADQFVAINRFAASFENQKEGSAA